MSSIESSEARESFFESFKVYLKPTAITMLFFGFSAGIPILLIFSSLSLWLREAGVERSAVTFFSWAALGYSFKFVWAPLVDQLPLPIMTKVFGRRRAWLLLSQSMVICAILGMGLTNPASSENSLTLMALFAVLLGFSSATQDIVVDAYRIESDSSDMQAALSATYIAGYRIGMIVAGAGALYLASLLGSTLDTYSYSAWMWTYILMAGTMLVGVCTTLIVKEPKAQAEVFVSERNNEYLRFFVFFLIVATSFATTFFLSSEPSEHLKTTLGSVVGTALAAFVVEALRLGFAILAAFLVAKVVIRTPLVNEDMVEKTYILPVKDFFQRYGTSIAILLLALIGLYRISDIVLGVISNVFYQDLGYTKNQIATVVKTFGVVMVIIGGFLGGSLTARFGVIKILFVGAVLSSATNLLFMLLAHLGPSEFMLYVVISADNLAAGLASAAFVAFLSSLTNVSFTAVQYAIFSSLMTLLPKVLGGYSGSIVDQFGYTVFFLGSAVAGIPVLFIIWKATKLLPYEPKK